jgi:hypothetical protein
MAALEIVTDPTRMASRAMNLDFRNALSSRPSIGRR